MPAGSMAPAAADPAPLPLDHARKIFPPVWVIYRHPQDYPTGYVVRVWYGLTPDPYGEPCASLVEAREYAVESGASFPLAHAPGLEADHIVESWL